MHPVDSAPTNISPSVFQLFSGFFGVSLMGFGGVFPFARWMLIERRAWLTPGEFNEVVALGQSLPGSNIINMAGIIGHRFQGFAGAIAAVSGLVIGPCAIGIGLAALYSNYRDLAGMNSALEGISAAAIGLIAATALKMVFSLKEEPVALLVAAIAFASVGVFRLPLLATLLVLAPLSVAYAWRRVR